MEWKRREETGGEGGVRRRERGGGAPKNEAQKAASNSNNNGDARSLNDSTDVRRLVSSSVEMPTTRNTHHIQIQIARNAFPAYTVHNYVQRLA